jgi:beta-lactamase superfamily II metal-dependent hydrolase
MNSKNSNFDDANEQSLVVKLEYGGNGVMLAGDTSYRSWKEFVEKYYSDSDLSSEILLASHHGSISFFDDPNDEKNYYVSHIKKINPAMTIISVGDSTLLDDKAVKLYEKYSRGSEQGNKVFTTLAKGNMLLTLKSEESWSLSSNQK